VLLMKENAADAHVISRYWRSDITYSLCDREEGNEKGESVDCPAQKRILIQTMTIVDGVKQRGGNNHV
jgi:hypothetical protein